MTRSTEQFGPNVEEALSSAIAELLDDEDARVTVEIRAEGLERLPAPVRLRLELEAVDVSEPSDTDDTDVEDTDDRESGGEKSRAADETAPADGPHPAAPVTADSDDDDASLDTPRPPRDADGGNGLTDADIEAEADAAADFLEGLLDALDLPGDLRIHLREDHAEIELVDIGSGALIGRRGQTLEAIQELVRCSLQREFQRRSRVKIDAEGYRARRLEKLLEKADEAIDNVLDSGEPERLEPMDVFERKAVHHLVAEVDGVMSRSQGREPGRRIIIEPS